MDISKYAKALPSILGLKERGKGIPALSDQAVGVVQLLDLYLLSDREFLNFAAITNPTIGFNVFAEAVPAGEMWRVWSYLCLSTLAAGEALDMCAAYRPDSTGGIAMAGAYASGIATNHLASGILPSQEFWAPAGTTFGFLVRSLTTLPDVGAYMTFSRLKI